MSSKGWLLHIDQRDKQAGLAIKQTGQRKLKDHNVWFLYGPGATSSIWYLHDHVIFCVGMIMYDTLLLMDSLVILLLVMFILLLVMLMDDVCLWNKATYLVNLLPASIMFSSTELHWINFYHVQVCSLVLPFWSFCSFDKCCSLQQHPGSTLQLLVILVNFGKTIWVLSQLFSHSKTILLI